VEGKVQLLARLEVTAVPVVGHSLQLEQEAKETLEVQVSQVVLHIGVRVVVVVLGQQDQAHP